MNIKFLQLNIFAGRFLDALKKYIKENDFDILSFQEVSGGEVSFGGQNCFQEISSLGYEGELFVTIRIPQGRGYFGQAVFFKPEYTLLRRNDVWFNPYKEIIDFPNRDFRDDPKGIPHIVVEKEGKKISIVSAHLAWTPDSKDSEEKLRQGKMFFDYAKNIQSPFIISGDFNVDHESQIIKWFDEIGENLAVKNNVTNTLNPKIHKAPHLFPPGLPVDYIFTSKNIMIKKFETVSEPDLSDHFGLSTEIEV